VIIVKKDFSAAEEKKARLAAAKFRKSKATSAASNVLNVADCNSCHRTGGQGPLHVP